MDTAKDFFTILVPLVIIMDPLGNLPVYLAFTRNNTPAERRRVAAVACLGACGVLILFGLTGDAILDFFGIGLPAFEIAGGFIFFIYSLQMLRLIPTGIKYTPEEEEEGLDRESVALVPLAIPLLAGPGAITSILVWQESAEEPLSTPLLIGAIVLACAIIYVVFLFGERIHTVLGVSGIRMLPRLMGLLLAVIAVQYVVSGVEAVIE